MISKISRLLTLLAFLPAMVHAQPDTCVGTITLDYPNPPAAPFAVGDVFHVRGNFGSGDIIGGTAVLFNKFQFDLDCDATFPLSPPCVDAGPIFSYNGDASITTNCGVSWSSNNPGGGTLPNQVEFDSTPVLAVPENKPNPPGFCEVRFDITLANLPPAGIKVAQILGYKIAFCDNGLTTGGFQTAQGAIEVPGNFDCYQVPRGRFAPQQTVQVTNQFADLTVTVNTLHRLCAPAQVNGEPAGLDLQGVHLAAYDIRSSSGTISHPTVTLSTPFGTRTGTVGSLTNIAIPTAKDFGSPPPQPPLGIVPPFACFRLNSTTGPAPTNLTTVDQFAITPLSVSKRGPFSLCVASQVGPLAPTGQPQALLCNHTDEDVRFTQASPFITNLFQSNQVTITQFDELCVPVVIH